MGFWGYTTSYLKRVPGHIPGEKLKMPVIFNCFWMFFHQTYIFILYEFSFILLHSWILQKNSWILLLEFFINVNEEFSEGVLMKKIPDFWKGQSLHCPPSQKWQSQIQVGLVIWLISIMQIRRKNNNLALGTIYVVRNIRSSLTTTI